jgi:mannose-1-phosphate guanylyltransferase
VARIAALHSHSGDGEAVLGFFPADHYFADEDAFAQTLDRAYRLAGQHANRILLLGAQPEHPEVEYGWIEPGAALDQVNAGHGDGAPIFGVNRFWEKPSIELARGLLDRGCLWNTFVMIGRVRSFFEALQASVPAVLHAFEPMLDFGGIAEEPLGRIYSSIAPGDFSQQVLSNVPERLAVLGFNNAWSDLGTPQRLMDTWSRFGVKPLYAMQAATSSSRY